jgi:hypothetical protein
VTYDRGMPSRLIAVLALVLLAALLPAAAADAKPKRCKSADLRFPFQEGGPDDFGVFKLRITGGKCSTAHRVAKKWMTRFERNISSDGKLKLPKHVEGFAFESLPPTAAQTFNMRGKKGQKTIRFDYLVPNG